MAHNNSISARKYNGFMQIIRNLLFLNNLQGINRLAITLTCHRKFIKSVPRRPTEGKKKKDNVGDSFVVIFANFES